MSDEPEFYSAYFGDKPTERPTPATPQQGPNKPYATAALSRELAELATTEPGRRNHQLNIAAFNLGQLVAAGHLEHASTYNLLRTTALSIGLTESETDATLRSGFGAGALQPRVVSELDQDPVPPVTVIDAPADEPLDGVPPSIRDRFPALDWKDLWADDSEDEWIVYPLLPARRLVALFSPPKVGKSLLMLEVAVAVSRGASMFGTKPERSRRVLYVDFENDPRGDIRTRLQAMRCEPDDLADLVYLSYPRLAWLDTYAGGLELLAVAQEYEVEVVVIDTISRAVSGEENANDTWLAFYRNTGQLLKAAGLSVMRLDHTGKDETKGMRGGSAKYGDVDAVWSMTRLGSTETFLLECTAHRLPIAEQSLVIERRTDPRLHHHLTMKRTGDVARDEAARVVQALDDLEAPRGIGREKAEKLLRDAGVPFTWKQLKDAVRDRKARDEGSVQDGIPGLPGGDDD